YPAHLAVHNLLIIASFFLLPRSVVLQPLPEQLRNLDRPQHPFLVPLTRRPEVTALWAALGNALLVAWWAGSVRDWVREGKLGLGMNERVRDQSKSAVRTAFTFYAALAYSIVIVLFGAPLSTHLLHTLLLGFNLAILTTLVPSYAIGVPTLPLGLPFILKTQRARGSDSALALNDTWIRLFAEQRPQNPSERAMLYPAVGSLLGAWAGVIPIGLDWDRPWQAYPLTPLFGATVGYVLGSFSGLAISIVYF
ncbi:GPI biosynthesis protein family Pig-F-domain-containing protein, partial [Vararia minispora EC-137]